MIQQAVTPWRKLATGTFASVGQDLVGIPSANETDVLFGTTVVLSSLDGSRLAVGAPKHDYSTAEADALSVNENGGAIFLYEYDGSVWNQIWFLAGDIGEELGESFSLSADGTRIAVRRKRDNPDSVEVYDILAGVATATPATLVGETVSCGANGDTVTLSADGERLAVSCENFRDAVLGANTGRVEIFDWTGSTWSSIGTIDGSGQGDFFGWTTAFSNDGNRIAISAPNHDRDLANRGQVRVFDYVTVSNEWSQVGEDILGDNALDQQGFSMDLSGDGRSLVVSSPGAGNDNFDLTGLVKVFVESGGTWSPVGNAIAGVDARDRFGRSVSITDNGTRLAASSYIHDSARGHLRLFDLIDGSWLQYGSDIDGENPADWFGNGRSSVTLTGDGRRVASGSTKYDDVGRVRVFNSAELVLTSTAPTFGPTSAPTFGPTSAPAFSPTAAPTFGPTAAPTFSPTAAPTFGPTSAPSVGPTSAPAVGPTSAPTFGPTSAPSVGPTSAPTVGPTSAPTAGPTVVESAEPTAEQTSGLTQAPTVGPTSTPTAGPTVVDSAEPTDEQTSDLTQVPTVGATRAPTEGPTAASQTLVPTTDATTDTTTESSTGAPSDSPSLRYAPSPGPTLSAAPSAAKTAAPSSLLGKTDWDIDRVEDITVKFAESAAEEEIKIIFSIHRRDATVQVFQEDCTTAVDESVIGVDTTRSPITGTKDTLEVFLDIKQDSVSESPIFSLIDSEAGKISLCVRVDLLSATDMSSVVFFDQKVFVTVDMTAGFAVTDIALVLGIDSVDLGASFDYSVTACQCNESFECAPQTLTQFSDTLICIETNTPNVEIASVRQLVFNQGSLAQNAVGNGAEDELTIVTVSGKKAVIRTKLASAFFGQEFPENVEAIGVCTLKFVNDNGTARRLNAPVSIGRILQQDSQGQAAEAGFDLELFFEEANESSGADKTTTVMSFMMAAMVYGAAMLM
jgi:hypothetical protein